MRSGRTRSGGRRSTVAALALGAAALALGACAAPRMDYFPRQVITDEAHIVGATQRLEETVARARAPRIVEVSADARELYYRIRLPVGRGQLAFGEVVVPYDRIARVQLFDGALVRLQDARGDSLAALRFHTQADAAQFADLVHSLRYWRPLADAPPPPERFGLDEPSP